MHLPVVYTWYIQGQISVECLVPDSPVPLVSVVVRSRTPFYSSAPSSLSMLSPRASALAVLNMYQIYVIRFSKMFLSLNNPLFFSSSVFQVRFTFLHSKFSSIIKIKNCEIRMTLFVQFIDIDTN